MSEADSRPITEVAVGIVFNPSGQVLMACRPTGKPYAGWWEFPGGKVEPGESVDQALARELFEETGIRIDPSLPWLTREHSYEHARVRLHFRRVFSFRENPVGREGQKLDWCDPLQPGVEPLLPASVPLMRLLGLPAAYGLSCASLLGVDQFLQSMPAAFERGIGMVQLREPGMPADQFDSLFRSVLASCRAAGVPLLVSSRHDPRYWLAADGVHLTSASLRAPLPVTVDQLGWVGASCHGASELMLAGEQGVDFAVLGPVLPTLSHPEATPMGWSDFQSGVLDSPVPVYALGGIDWSHRQTATQSGAHGIAMMRAAFEGH